MRFPPIAILLLVSTLAVPGSGAAAEVSTVEWAVAGGGAGSDDADGVGTDARGRVVISGGFDSLSALGTEIFATGYTAKGDAAWTRRYGGAGADQAFDNDVDSRGNAVITGSFNGTVDFGGPALVSRGATLPRYGDAFLLKLDPGGTTKWVRQIGGVGSDGGDEVAVGPRRNSYVIGDAIGPVTFSPSVALAPGGGRDSWVARYQPDGALVWARSLGGTGEQQSHGISADRQGNVLVTGEFRGTSTFGSHRLDSAGPSPDTFLAKLDRRGQVLWAHAFGDGDRELGRGVDGDARGNIYFTGEFAGTIQLGETTLTSSGVGDSFLARAAPNGRVRWAIGVGGAGPETGPEIEVDRDGNSYLTGTFSGSARVGGLPVSTTGARGAYVAKVSRHGQVLWVVQSAESPFATLGELSLGPGTVDVLGRFVGAMQFGAFTLAGAGATDYFLGRLRR
jgi:large repetitive protein